MRFMMYNIRYCTGAPRKGGPLSFFSGYMGRTQDQLGKIIDFIQPYGPDILGLVEVDAGSYRTGRKSQAMTIAERLSHYHAYRSKYGLTSRWRHIPVMNKQGNAFLTKDTVRHERFHYFNKGMKKLVIELELDDLTIFLVHLALGSRVRHQQLGELYNLIKSSTKPYIVSGDFNALWGENEIQLFMAASGLSNANTESAPSFPSWAPRRHLDFILYSKGILPRSFEMPRVVFSDHLPLVFDFEVSRDDFLAAGS